MSGQFMFTRRLLPFQILFSVSRVWLIKSMSSSTTTTVRSPSLRKIAVGQLCSSADKLTNLCNAAICARRAKEAGAAMLFLPENFGFMGESSKEAVEHAEPPTLAQECENSARVIQMIKDTVTGNDVDIPKTRTSTLKNYPTDDQEQSISLLSGLQTIAQEAGLWISACMHTSGAPPASTQQEPRIYNTHLVVDNTGGIRAQYKKIHLFDVSIPGQVELQESRSTAPGNQVIVCDSPIGRLGLSTCYDVRFPELYIQLVKRGVEVVLVPSAFTVPTGKAHWHTLLRARAIETQCFVVAAAQYGVHNSKRESYGHSLVVDPWGTVLVDVGGKDSTDCESLPVSPHVVVCDLNFDLVAEVRQRMPIQQHRETADYDVV